MPRKPPKHSSSEIKILTGYPKTVLDRLWEQYSPAFPITTRYYDFVNVFIYIHHYCKYKLSKKVFGFSPLYISQRILPLMNLMANTFDEIDWNDRLNNYNHSWHFPYLITGIIDTFPIYVSQPKTYRLAKLLFNGKYKRCIYKIQLGIDFLGRIIVFSGPHLGIEYDGNIWEDTSHNHPTAYWEYLIGDGHYIACQNVITPYPGYDLQYTELFF